MKIQRETSDLVIFESSLFRTTTTLIMGKDYYVLVDPNWLPNEITIIEQYIQARCSGKDPYLLYTHSDYDHIIGYGKFRHCRTIASVRFTENLESQSILQQIRTFDDEYYITRSYPVEYPRIDLAVAGDGIGFEIAGDEWIFYQARGHNCDGLLAYQPSGGVLIAGDYLSNIEFPYIDDSIGKYRQTLDKLEWIITSGEIRILITGHGDYAENREEMLQRIEDSRDYLEKLELSVRSDTLFDLDWLFRKYRFPGIMKKFHETNVKIVRKELQLTN
jgi:hydroxyacylglutathione hydrolase